MQVVYKTSETNQGRFIAETALVKKYYELREATIIAAATVVAAAAEDAAATSAGATADESSITK